MKITEFTRDRQVIELGALGAIGGAIGGAAKAVGGAIAGGAKAAGSALGQAAQAAAGTMGGGAEDPQAAAKIAAANVIQMAERKKQIQDDIKTKQQEIQNLQKELATIK
jgi:hypothetical protein